MEQAMTAAGGLAAWVTAGLVFAAAVVAVRLAGRLFDAALARWLAAKGLSADADVAASLDRSVWWLAWTLGLFAATRRVSLGPGPDRIVFVVLLCAVSYAGIATGYDLLRTGLDLSLRRRGASLAEHGSRAFLPVIKAAAWLLAAVFILDNLGFEVSALLAGLGVAGVAVGFAAQAVLGDLFSYFSILLDRPFRIGDFITLGEHMGVIEHIGLKTTRIRSLGGEQIVLSNSDLTGSRVRNYRRMTRRRVSFAFGVVYQTPADKLEEIPSLVRAAVEAVDKATFDRAHFLAFGESSLDFEVVFYVESPDYNVYMDVRQAINLALVRAFEARGVAFAYPTRTLYAAHEEGVDA